jgi:hypothetical protein
VNSEIFTIFVLIKRVLYSGLPRSFFEILFLIGASSDANRAHKTILRIQSPRSLQRLTRPRADLVIQQSPLRAKCAYEFAERAAATTQLTVSTRLFFFLFFASESCSLGCSTTSFRLFGSGILHFFNSGLFGRCINKIEISYIFLIMIM